MRTETKLIEKKKKEKKKKSTGVHHNVFDSSVDAISPRHRFPYVQHDIQSGGEFATRISLSSSFQFLFIFSPTLRRKTARERLDFFTKRIRKYWDRVTAVSVQC